MRARLTYANVMSTLAVFIVLGGSSYAAVKLGKGAVKNRNLANNAVTGKKVKNRSLTAKDFKAGALPAGAQGPQGAPGTNGTNGTNGAQGPTGPAGPAGPVIARGTQLEGTGNIDTSGKTVAVLGPSTEIPDTSGAYGKALTLPPGTYYMVTVNGHAQFASTPPAGSSCSIDAAGKTGAYFTRASAPANDADVYLNTTFPIFRPADDPASEQVVRVRLFCQVGSGTESVSRAELSAIAFDNTAAP